MIVAQFKIIPVGHGSSMRSLIHKVTQTLDQTGVRYHVGPIGTTLEAESIEAIFEAVARVDAALQGMAPRIQIDVSIDHRFDKEVSMASLTAPFQRPTASASTA